MATVKKLKITIKLNDNKTAVINLPEPINNTLTDPDEGLTIWDGSAEEIFKTFATDNGATPASLDMDIITTDTLELVNDYVHSA